MTFEEYQELLLSLSSGNDDGLQSLPVLGRGTRRDAYLLEVDGFEPTAIKVDSKSGGSWTHQEVACLLNSFSDLLPEMYDYGPLKSPRWVELELLRPISKKEFTVFTGIPWNAWNDAAYEIEGPVLEEYAKRAITKARRKSQDLKKTGWFFDQILMLVSDCYANIAELGMIENWGVNAEWCVENYRHWRS